MKKALLCLVFAVFAAVASAAVPGSYAPVTIKLTASGYTTTTTGTAADSIVTWKPTKKTITNDTILKELQKKGVIPAGSLSAWRLLALFDENGELLGVIAANAKNKAVWADRVIELELPAVSGSGSVTFKKGKLVSGAMTQTTSGLFEMQLGKVSYEAGVIATGSHVATAVNKSVTVMKPSPFKSTAVAGAGSDDSVLTGVLSTGSATVAADLEKVFVEL